MSAERRPLSHCLFNNRSKEKAKPAAHFHIGFNIKAPYEKLVTIVVVIHHNNKRFYVYFCHLIDIVVLFSIEFLKHKHTYTRQENESKKMQARN